MTNQTTDEAAVDIVELLRWLGRPAIRGGDSITWRAADEIETLRAQLTAATAESRRFKALADDHFRNARQIAERYAAATRRAEQLAAEETCPCCEGKPMGPGEGCIAGCRDGVVFTTTANVLRNVLPWLHSADRRAEQAERMLAERDAALQLTRESLCKVEIAVEEMGNAFAGTVDASWKRIEPIAVIHGKRFVAAAKKATSAIRSAASGEQGA